MEKLIKTIIVTGKSGSGKSYIANQIANFLNCPVINLDEISHKTLTLPQVKNFVKSTFGPEVFENNDIITKKLGKIAFSQQDKLNQLNNFCHEEMLKIIDEILKNTQSEFIVLDYLLLPKMKYFETAFFKVLVKANNSIRKSRIIARDKVSEEYFNLRDNNSIEFKENDYNYILENSTSIDISDLIIQIKNKISQK